MDYLNRGAGAFPGDENRTCRLDSGGGGGVGNLVDLGKNFDSLYQNARA